MSTSAFGVVHKSVASTVLNQSGLLRNGRKTKRLARMVGLSGLNTTETGNKISRSLLARSKMDRLNNALKGKRI